MRFMGGWDWFTYMSQPSYVIDTARTMMQESLDVRDKQQREGRSRSLRAQSNARVGAARRARGRRR